MLINLSNHPFEQWSEIQKQTAIQLYGDVTDMLFPQINPEADDKEVLKIAEEYFNNIINSFSYKDFAVHIMGELCFCFTIIQMLQKYGIKCIASTSKRNVVQKENVKTTVFEFCRFREYPKINNAR
jgi:hypothetical protein